MERDIPFFERPRVEGRLVHASFGWGGAGDDDRHGRRCSWWPTPTAAPSRCCTASSRRARRCATTGPTSRPGRRASSPGPVWPVAAEKAANFAVAREEDAARRLLEDLERDAFAVARAEGAA
ncbi:MAG: hypothetical protein U0838_05735 [Chloroflexota bacterium]